MASTCWAPAKRRTGAPPLTPVRSTFLRRCGASASPPLVGELRSASRAPLLSTSGVYHARPPAELLRGATEARVCPPRSSHAGPPELEATYRGARARGRWGHGARVRPPPHLASVAASRWRGRREPTSGEERARGAVASRCGGESAWRSHVRAALAGARGSAVRRGKRERREQAGGGRWSAARRVVLCDE